MFFLDGMTDPVALSYGAIGLFAGLLLGMGATWALRRKHQHNA